jgi:hypothetical protein
MKCPAVGPRRLSLTAPTSAGSSSLRRVSAGRKSPTLLCLHRYAATASAGMSIKKRRGGWVEAFSVQSVGVCAEVGVGLYL